VRRAVGEHWVETGRLVSREKADDEGRFVRSRPNRGFGAALATAAVAGGPIYTYDPVKRIPYAWNMASWPDGQVPIYTDLGSLGILTNAQANDLVGHAARQWSSVPTSSFRAVVAGDFGALGLVT
jgi:hypothetical protein